MIRQALALVLLAAPAAADPTSGVEALLAYHRSACSAQGGTLTVPDAAIRPAYLNGPEDPAKIVDSGKLACSTAPAMFCGDGIGCELNVFVGDAQHSLVVLDWSVIPDDDRELLQVTIAGELLDKPEPGTFRMTWDSAAGALATID